MYSHNIVQEAYEYVLSLLKDTKENGYCFHNLDHTLEVYERAIYICNKENINDELSELVKLWALFHDTGFLYQYDNNEPMARNLLEKFSKKKDWGFQERLNFSPLVNDFLMYYNYPHDKLEIVNNLILATMPYLKPNNILESIIKDSDMDNVWREDFFEKWSLIRQELKNIKWIEYTDLQWAKNVYSLMRNFQYWTTTQINERWKKYWENMETLKIMIDSLS